MPATLITLATLTSPPGFTNIVPAPFGNLIAVGGDLIGTAADGDQVSSGNSQQPADTLFEVSETPGGTPTNPLVTLFPDNEGIDPEGLVADANGDLFGTTELDGTNGDGTVFEIAKAVGGGYASSPETLVSFDGADGEKPDGSLFIDSNGDLFGTTLAGGGENVFGTVFEIKNNAGVYATTPTTLASFTVSDSFGADPKGNLVADSQGDLFGTTHLDGADTIGAVFEIKKTAGGYSAPTVVAANFNTDVGSIGDLFADANGDLFGTTTLGGGYNSGSVFEIAKTGGSYATTPTMVASLPPASLNPNDGELLTSTSLIVDANGDVFGTTLNGGPANAGVVFEIVNTPTGYEKTPRFVVSFNDADGRDSETTLIADAEGDLFGTTSANSSGTPGGTIFEITDSGFVPAGSVSPGVPSDLLFQNADGQAAIWSLTGTKATDSGAVSANPGPGWKAVATGDFNADGHADILWQNAAGEVAIWDMNGADRIGGGAISTNPGESWKAVGTGDFNDDLHSDILLQNTSGQLLIWELSPINVIIGGGTVGPNPGPAWKAVGTGDFNDDGDSDILLQNTNTGQISIWEMNGNTRMGGGAVSINPGPDWQAIGAGDFNHDGFSDILLQNKDTGALSVWEMDGTNRIGGGLVANPGLSWHAIGTGSEGTSSDILLQNASGQVSIWEMNGNAIAGGGQVGANPGSNWKAIGLGL